MTFELKAVDIFGGVLKVRLKNDSTFSLAKNGKISKALQ